MMTVSELNLIPVLQLLQQAHGKGLKYPKLRFRRFHFSLASAKSHNFGCAYWHYDGVYKGKICKDGIVKASLDGPAVTVDEVDSLRALQTFDGLLSSLEAEGVKTGICCCCGRLLTNETSVSLGIGPICRANWGF